MDGLKKYLILVAGCALLAYAVATTARAVVVSGMTKAAETIELARR